MVGSVPYIRMYAEYREASEDTSLCCFLNTLTDCRDVFLRNRTTDYGRFKLKCLFAIWIHWLKFNFTVTVLSTTTRLFRILAINIDRRRKCLFVGNLRSTYICFHLKFTKKTVYDDLQVKLTHSGNDRLSGFLICVSAERRILLCEFRKSFSHFSLVILCLWLDCELDNRIREFHRLKNNRMLLVTNCITCRCQLKSNCGSDISRIHLV